MRIKVFLFLLFSFCFELKMYAQLQLNEILVNNWTDIQDCQFQYESWVELKNTSNDPIDLSQYHLSDDSSNLKKWQIPEAILAPNDHKVIYCSGKNFRKELYWRSVVYAQDKWRYFPTHEYVDSIWKSPIINDSDWFEGHGRFGSDNNIYNTRIAPHKYLYLRKEFNIYDIDQIGEFVLQMDCDDAFIAYLNGKELIQRNVTENVGQNGIPKAAKVHVSKSSFGYPPKDFQIAQNKWKGLLKEGSNLLAIVIINHEDSFETITADPYIMVAVKNEVNPYRDLPQWWSRKDCSVHTNFKIKPGENLFLSDIDGQILERAKLVETHPNYSWVKNEEATDKWSIAKTTTPSEENVEDYLENCEIIKPRLTIESGFYADEIKAKLQKRKDGAVVRYSTNGSLPTETSPVFPTSLTIDSNVVLTIRPTQKTL